MTGPQHPQEHCGHECVCGDHIEQIRRGLDYNGCSYSECDQRIPEISAAPDKGHSCYACLCGQGVPCAHKIIGCPHFDNDTRTRSSPAAAPVADSKTQCCQECDECTPVCTDDCPAFKAEHDEQIRRQAAATERERVLDAAITMLTDGLEDMPATTIPEVRQGKIDAIEWAVEKLESLRKPQEPQA